MNSRRLIVTHHAPDLDAIGAVWLLKRFLTHHYGTAHLAFVNPGDTISDSHLESIGVTRELTTHVDTGLGEFDHHQPDRGHQFICASSLVFDLICHEQPDKNDDAALQAMIEFITDIDHFQEINWPSPEATRYHFMIHELISGVESTDPHNDESIMQFGMQCLDAAYAQLTIVMKAKQSIAEHGQEFKISQGQALAIDSDNDDVIKEAQKQGYVMVIRKDSSAGHIRIKVRPDANLDLKALANAISSQDNQGTWYYHPSGKMLLNGSSKHRDQRPTKLSLDQVVNLAKELYG